MNKFMKGLIGAGYAPIQEEKLLTLDKIDKAIDNLFCASRTCL